MIYGDYSWVAFISDQSLDVEIVEGLNENLVNGSVSPIRLQLLDNNTLSSKSTNLPPQMLSELQSSMIQINQIFNKSMDVEFTIKWDKIYVLQARPITINYDYKIESSKLLSNIGCFNHIIVSKGSFSWKFIVITSEGDIQKIKEDSIIVVTDKLYQGFIPKLHKIKGIIAEHWGQLAHLAIVGREMKVPIISDCVWIVDKLKDTTYTFLTYDQEALSFK
jgi:phosphoenolpyruvate synthase/pyruvate phosphate dikinase